MTARERFAALAARADAELPLAETALLIAAEEYAGLDVGAWLARLEALGARAARRITADAGLEDAAAALNRLLFEEEGFRGNTRDYYDPRNSFLNEVLERRLGIPITLSVVYIEVAARAGVAARGVGLPGHFVVRLERHGRHGLLDPFHGGRALDDAGCRALVERVTGGPATLGPRHLAPVTTRQILARMLGNLKGVYSTARDWPRALAAVERTLLLLPGAPDEVRDRGTLRARLGRHADAIRDWEAYLRQAPDAADIAAVRRELRALRQRLAALN